MQNRGELQRQQAAASGDYRQARRAAYPPVGDQLDALGKCLAHMKAIGTDIGPDAAALALQLQSVKDRFPK